MNLWKTAQVPLVVSLVTTVNDRGQVNASPKTWWTPTSYDPPRLILCTKPESDTTRNIEETGMFALHLPPGHDREVTRKVLHTAKPLPYGENELDDVGLKWQFMQHPEMKMVEFAAVNGMPFFGCMVASKMPSNSEADHVVYSAQVVMAALVGEGSEMQQVESILLHRGVNKFVHTGIEYEVERY